MLYPGFIRCFGFCNRHLTLSVTCSDELTTCSLALGGALIHQPCIAIFGFLNAVFPRNGEIKEDSLHTSITFHYPGCLSGRPLGLSTPSIVETPVYRSPSILLSLCWWGPSACFSQCCFEGDAITSLGTCCPSSQNPRRWRSEPHRRGGVSGSMDRGFPAGISWLWRFPKGVTTPLPTTVPVNYCCVIRLQSKTSCRLISGFSLIKGIWMLQWSGTCGCLRSSSALGIWSWLAWV